MKTDTAHNKWDEVDKRLDIDNLPTLDLLALQEHILFFGFDTPETQNIEAWSKFRAAQKEV